MIKKINFDFSEAERTTMDLNLYDMEKDFLREFFKGTAEKIFEDSMQRAFSALGALEPFKMFKDCTVYFFKAWEENDEITYLVIVEDECGYVLRDFLFSQKEEEENKIAIKKKSEVSLSETSES